jgi:hypothetical protein
MTVELTQQLLGIALVMRGLDPGIQDRRPGQSPKRAVWMGGSRPVMT